MLMKTPRQRATLAGNPVGSHNLHLGSGSASKSRRSRRRSAHARLLRTIMKPPRSDHPGLQSDDEDISSAVQYTDQQSMFHAIRAAFKANKHVQFHGTCQIPEDPLVTDKDVK
ncbi:hypothetical protein K438DRAFT_1852610 [Mycena galopus ATCC 62051]|nr:hypothetical protein K438DRAFT_1852610 [Mycena galopus ATCC 62051]